MKKFTATDETTFRVYKALDRKNYEWYDFEDLPPNAFGKRLSVWRGGLQKWNVKKKNTPPVKKSR